MKSSLEINYHFARFHLYCHYVRGIRDIRDSKAAQICDTQSMPTEFHLRLSIPYSLRGNTIVGGICSQRPPDRH
jgi:hypothetical protein